MGSKGRHARHIVPLLMDGHDDRKPYIEPFVGGGNMIQHVPASIRWGSDIDPDVIALLYGLAHGWLPPDTLSEVDYKAIKAAPENFEGPLVGFAKFCCSFGGTPWGTYARTAGRDLSNEQSRALHKEAPRLRGCHFKIASYLDLTYPNGSTVYMDPPYAATTGYKQGFFDHDRFWTFARRLSKRRRVFVSEYSAPEGWEAIWAKPVKANFDSNRGEGSPRTEKLFVWRGK